MKEITYEGLNIQLSRSSWDGRLVVDINTENLTEEDTHGNGVPDIAIVVNEHEQTIAEDGSYIPRRNK